MALEEDDETTNDTPCSINVLPDCLLNSIRRLLAKQQRGGGDASESSSTSSTSSNESSSVDRILAQLKKSKKGLKKEMANLDKDIAFMRKLKKGERKGESLSRGGDLTVCH